MFKAEFQFLRVDSTDACEVLVDDLPQLGAEVFYAGSPDTFLVEKVLHRIDHGVVTGVVVCRQEVRDQHPIMAAYPPPMAKESETDGFELEEFERGWFPRKHVIMVNGKPWLTASGLKAALDGHGVSRGVSAIIMSRITSAAMDRINLRQRLHGERARADAAEREVAALIQRNATLLNAARRAVAEIEDRLGQLKTGVSLADPGHPWRELYVCLFLAIDGREPLKEGDAS